MSFIQIEAVNARNAELRRVADADRRHRALRAAHQTPAERPPRRARRPLRAVAAAAVTRVAR